MLTLNQLAEARKDLTDKELRQQYRLFFSRPENIGAFSRLFENHIQSEVPNFHREIYKLFTEVSGNKAIAAPRGFSKSTITDLVFLAFVALNARKRFIILISDTFTQATMLLESLKAELEGNEIIRWLYGDMIGTLWSDNDIIINGIDEDGVRKSVRIIAKGAGMKIRGLKYLNFRPDLVLIDDLENDELVESEERRRKLKNWFKKGVLPALAFDGEVIMIGTLLHRDSLLTNIIHQTDEFQGWNTKLYAALVNGESLWPDRFTTEEITAWRDNPKHPKYLGPIAFSQEIMNNPINEEDQIIKPEWLNQRFKLQEELNKFKNEHPETEDADVLMQWCKSKFKMIISSVDPAISEKTTADYWAQIHIGIAREDGHIWILDYERVREGDLLKQGELIINKYVLWHEDKLKVETVAFQAGLKSLVQRLAAERNIYLPIMAYKPDKDKVRRAIMHSANFAGGLVHIRDDHPLATIFIEEVLAFPQGTHDDMFDAYMATTDDTIMKRRQRTFKEKPALFS